MNNASSTATDFSHSPTGQEAPAPRERLPDSKRMLIEQRIANEKPSTGTAYLLCLFFGAFGVHRLYLGEKGTGILMLILGITLVGLLISAPWAFIDLFLIPSIIRRRIDELRQRLTLEAIA